MVALDASTRVGAFVAESFRLWRGALVFGSRSFASLVQLLVLAAGAFLLICGFWSSASDAFRLWRNAVGGAAGGGCNVPTAPQQGAAPDRRQFGSFCKVSALLQVGRNWAAAGELGRSVDARGVAVIPRFSENRKHYVLFIRLQTLQAL